MKRKPLCLTFACLCSLLIVGHAADTKATSDVVTVSGPLRVAEPSSFDVDFGGGSVNKLIDAVTKVYPTPFTIIFNAANPNDAKDFSKVELPAFSLRNVSLKSVVEILGNLIEQRGFTMRPVGGPNSFVCMIQKIPANEKSNVPQTQFFSYQLAPYLQAQSVDDIVGALHAAWELDPAHAPDALHVKYHPGTSILLVSGPPEGIVIARVVLGELKRSPEPKAAARSLESMPDKK